MFGFALWDARRQRLLVGRDRLGIKPLYWLHDGRRVAFASEAKALLALPGVSRRDRSRRRCRAICELGYVPAPLSMLARHPQAAAGALLIVEVTGGVRGARYWQPPTDVDAASPHDEWIERVRARLEESVRMQMVSDVPIGAFLSGGIDSSAVLALWRATAARR